MIKFRYVFKREKTEFLKADVQIRIFELEQLEIGAYERHIRLLADERYGIISRDRFTEREDKKGKYIFERDVIISEVFGNLKMPVIFKDGAYCIEYDNNICTLFALESEDMELIGDIHRNPELLKS